MQVWQLICHLLVSGILGLCIWQGRGDCCCHTHGMSVDVGDPLSGPSAIGLLYFLLSGQTSSFQALTSNSLSFEARYQIS